MRFKSKLPWRLLVVILLVTGSARMVCAQIPVPFDFSQIDQEMYEFIGQVKNSPPAGPGCEVTQGGPNKFDFTIP